MSSHAEFRPRRASLEVDHFTKQSNQTEASRVMQTLAEAANTGSVDERAARIVGVLQREGIEVNSVNLEHVAQLMEVPKTLQASGGPSSGLTVLRELAANHAQWSQRQPRTSTVAPQPASGGPSTATVMTDAARLPPTESVLRPLPAALAAVARRLGVPVADVQRLRDALGGTFGAKDAVDYLRSRGGSPLSATNATELVKAIRNAQNDSTRGVKVAIRAALARTAPPGQSQAVFTNADWKTMAPLLDAQPALDNAAARELRSLLGSGRVDPQARVEIVAYLKSVGDEFTLPAGRTDSTEAVPTSNLSTTDPNFSKLLILTGQTQAQVTVGVADLFSTTTPGPSVVFNSQVLPPAMSSSTEHGHAVTSLVGKTGRWVDIKTVTLPDMFSDSPTAFSQFIDRLAAQNVRVLNISLNAKAGSMDAWRTRAQDWRAAMARHPEVLFVIGAGNDGANSIALPFAGSIAAGMPNVMYVGSVDAAGNLAASSTHGKTVDIYAPGEKRQVAYGRGNAYEVESGTSLASPEVTSVAAKMLVLCPTLTPAATRAIIRETASAPPAGATDTDGSVARAGILNGDAATKVAALMTLTGRVGGLESAASVMKLSVRDRSRLIPIAQRQLALASSPQRTVTTPARALDVRVHHRYSMDPELVNGRPVTDEQISRLAGGADATLIDVMGFRHALWIQAASKDHGHSIDLEVGRTDIRIERDPLLWSAGASNKRSAAVAETRALAILATQAQALGLKTISIPVQPGTTRAAEWSARGFSVALPDTKYVVSFDLTRGSRSWQQLAQKVKSLRIQLPAGLPADAMSANEPPTRGFFRKLLDR